jgi:uncharacterized membrane protein YedE/YeeE
METKEKVSYYDILIKKEWSYITGGVIMSILAVMLMTFSGNWGVTGVLSPWGGKFLTLLGINADSWKMYNGSLAKFSFFGNQTNILNVALVFGALISCLLAAQWKIRMIKHHRQVWAGIVGGLLMGFGARLSNGCNIGAMFSSLPALALSGWVFLVCVILGATVGGKMLVRWFMPPVSHERREGRKKLTVEQRGRNKKIQITLGVILIALWIIFAVTTNGSAPRAGFQMFIGLGIGYAMQRSRWCFTAAYRDPTLTGSTKIARALIIALAVSTIGFAGVQMSRYGVDLANLPESIPGVGKVGLPFLIGAFAFGIGAVVAGGCASGTFIRTGEGYVQNMLALVFFIIGSMFGVWTVTNVINPSPFLSAGARVYLPSVFGGFGPAILIQLAALLLLWIYADQWERKKTESFGISN